MTRPEVREARALSDEFHAHIGYCIAEWARIDDELFRVFRDCVGPYEQCAIIYYRLGGLDARLGLTTEIVESVLPSPERKAGGHSHPCVKQWREIDKKIRGLLSVRRRIAHHPVAIVVNLDELDDSIAPSWFELYESEHEKIRGRNPDKANLPLQKLKEHRTQVNDTVHEIRRFFTEVLIVEGRRAMDKR